MAIFKCKMCGGALEVAENETTAVCEYCGTRQTLPRLNDEGKANLYDRANHFRRNNEFDRAMGIYEQILNADPDDAEAYWSLVLCRYGIEYVEDPDTHKRIPTVNRTQLTSIFADPDYKQALQHADGMQREMYEEEAKAIDQLEKNILAISEQEDSFDVFICYKETDALGSRTPDSVLANELYHELTEEGFKVFFARITLENKLGYAYEPYIFAALNSAKVMVVIGTKPEYFNAPWVKNEWSRYLALIKNGASKMLIPAYRDMDPYDLPEEFAHLQAQDMAKLGFMQDLIHGIKKLAAEPQKGDVRKPDAVSAAPGAAPLLRRAFLFLEDGDFASADEYCEKVLDLEPENAQAYLGKLLSRLELRKKEELSGCWEPFDEEPEYQKIVRFGDSELLAILQGYINEITKRNEAARIESMYQEAVLLMSKARWEDAYQEAARKFSELSGYKDSEARIQECLDMAEIMRKDSIYADAIRTMKDRSVRACDSAIRKLELIPGWKDADEKLSECRILLEELKIKAEEERKEQELRREQMRRRELEKAKRARIFKWIKMGAAIAVGIGVILKIVLYSQAVQYSRARSLQEDGRYEEAAEKYLALTGYKDAADQAENCYKELYGAAYDKLRKLVPGATYRFGTYNQLNDANEKQKIEWIVLEKEGRNLLLVSKYALDVQPYHTERTEEPISWEECSLRQWLNTVFIETAFDEKEREFILGTKVVQERERNTFDWIFLLSESEVQQYWKEKILKGSLETPYTEALNIYCIGRHVEWWLRTPGKDRGCKMLAYNDIDILERGQPVDYSRGGVRPAMWVTFSAE